MNTLTQTQSASVAQLKPVSNNSDTLSKDTSLNDPLRLNTPSFVLKGDVLPVKFDDEKMSSIISEKSVTSGMYKTPEGLRVDGTHNGDIKAKTVLVMVNGVVNGNINAERVIILGTVRGDITSTEQLIFSSTAKVSSNVRYEKFASFIGHQFEGSMKRI